MSNSSIIDWNDIPVKLQKDIESTYVASTFNNLVRYKKDINNLSSLNNQDFFLAVDKVNGRDDIKISSLTENVYPTLNEGKRRGDEETVKVCLELIDFVKNTPDNSISVACAYFAKSSEPAHLREVSADFFVRNFPLGVVFVYATTEDTAKNSKTNYSSKPKEKDLEADIYSWLRLANVDVERQVTTSCGQRIDLWIPNVCMVEMKAKTVSGNDVCQCIDYASEYDLPIILCGDKITTAASRGLHGYEKVNPGRIVYVPTNTLKQYLKGLIDE